MEPPAIIMMPRKMFRFLGAAVAKSTLCKTSCITAFGHGSVRTSDVGAAVPPGTSIDMRNVSLPADAQGVSRLQQRAGPGTPATCRRAGTFNLHSEMPDNAVHLRVPRVSLNSARVPRLPVDLLGFRPAHGVRAVGICLEADRRESVPSRTGVLPHGDLKPLVEPTRPEMSNPIIVGWSSHLVREIEVPAVISEGTDTHANRRSSCSE